ncbi:helix-turn-helix transcriptional regulator [Prevotella corporis]|uniref:helix-turn-helix transcriptional regulator n=1 Tax=Prevotella corporis TaxID=28128 RepID=UPI0023F03B3A|nr:helix-turn-helix transcriptional regulator [Prevotella corporis]
MKDRIKQLMDDHHMSQQTFADFIGISTASLSSIFNGRTKPTLNTVDAIRSKFTTISLEWLLYGSGPMYNDQKSDSLPEPQTETKNIPSELFGDNQSSALPFNFSDASDSNNVHGISNKVPQFDAKIFDKKQRNITEIRIFFDDQTWETFLPKK